jgi:hypothetical protein
MCQEKANLARIRDNQRRSRARRKDYIRQLEERVQECAAEGQKATLEVQCAARQVVEENRRLRTLLAHYGMGDDNLEACLRPPPKGNSMMGNQSGTGIDPAQVLETMLNTRRECCVRKKNIVLNNNSGLADKSSPSSPESGIQQSPWNTPSIYNTSGFESAPEPDQNPQHSKQSRRTVSSTNDIDHTSNQHASHQQIPNMASYVQVHAQSSNSRLPMTQQQVFSHDDPISVSARYSYQPPRNHHQDSHGSPLYTTMASPNNINSHNCNFATDMITSVSGGMSDPNDIRAALGCAPGMECEVDNHLVFNVMDQYSGSGVA